MIKSAINAIGNRTINTTNSTRKNPQTATKVMASKTHSITRLRCFTCVSNMTLFSQTLTTLSREKIRDMPNQELSRWIILAMALFVRFNAASLTQTIQTCKCRSRADTQIFRNLLGITKLCVPEPVQKLFVSCLGCHESSISNLDKSVKRNLAEHRSASQESLQSW